MGSKTILLLVFLFAKYTDCRSIYVSRINSADNSSCGIQAIPCETISYAFKHIADGKDCIKIDGGSNATQYQYILDSSIVLTKSVCLTNWKQKSNRPIITHIVKSAISVFQLNIPIKLNITLSNVDFINIPLISSSYALNLRIDSCDFRYSPTEVIKIITQKEMMMGIYLINSNFYDFFSFMTVTSFHGSLDIIGCNFQLKTVPKHRNGLTIVGSETMYSDYLTNKPYFSVKVDQCFFTKLHTAIYIPPSTVNGTVDRLSLLVKGSIFTQNYESVVTFPYYEVKVENTIFTNNDGFNGSCVSVKFGKKTAIENTVFKNNTGGAVMIRVDGGTNLVRNCSFLQNSVKRNGGAIYVDGNMDIEDSMFLNDTATFLGGAIYHKCTFQPEYAKCFSLHLKNVSMKTSRFTPKYNGAHLSSADKIKFNGVQITMSKPLDSEMFQMEGITTHDVRLIRSFNFKCPTNFHAVVVEPNDNSTLFFFSISCRRCSRGLYSLDAGSVHATKSSNTSYKIGDAKCHSCPIGAKCVNGIISKDNFWGYIVNNTRELRFSSCPPFYCCSNSAIKCTSYNTCNANRTGVLCGKCLQNYTQNYFGHNCVPNVDCQRFLFWSLCLLYSLVFVFFLAYFKEISEFVRERIIKSDFQAEGNKITIFFYYQIGTSLSVTSQHKENEGFLHRLTNVVAAIFDFHLISDKLSTLCPANHITSMTKEAIKVLVILTFFILLGIVYAVYVITKHKTVTHDSNSKPIGKHNPTFAKEEVSNQKGRHQSENKASDVFNQDEGNDAATVTHDSNLEQNGKHIPTFAHDESSNQVEIRQEETVINQEEGSNAAKAKDDSQQEVTFKVRTKVCFLQITLLTYTAITHFSFTMTKCVSVYDESRLFIYADQICFTWWQYLLIIFIVLWVVPFPLIIYFSCKFLRRKKIGLGQFYKLILFPPIALYYCAKRKQVNSDAAEDIEKEKILDVFTGPFQKEENDHSIWKNWEAVILARRLILGIMLTIISNPVIRLFSTLPILILSLIHHMYVMPFIEKTSNILETVSLLLLIILNSLNLFWAFDYMSDTSQQLGMQDTATLFAWIEDIILFVPVLFLMVIVIWVVGKRVCPAVARWYRIVKEFLIHPSVL